MFHNSQFLAQPSPRQRPMIYTIMSMMTRCQT